jgi:PPIC-type PPIASE domain
MVKFLFIIVIIFGFGCKNEEKKRFVAAPKASKTIKKIDIPNDPSTMHVLKRNMKTGQVHIKNIMIMFGKISPRFLNKKVRTVNQASEVVKKVLIEIKNGKNYEDLMKKYSDDPSTAPRGDFRIVKNKGVSTIIKQLALRLNINEIGVVKGTLGYSIVKRIPLPKKLPSIDSTEIIKRTTLNRKISYRFITIAWRSLIQEYDGKLSKEAMNRDQKSARTLALKVFKELKDGKDFQILLKEHKELIPHDKKFKPLNPLIKGGLCHDSSHNHGKKHSKPHGKNKKNKKDGPKSKNIVPVQLFAMRLKINESGIITSNYGYHIIKRFK